MQNTTEKSSRSAEGLYKFFIYFVLVLLAVTIIVPVAWVFMASIKQNAEFYGNPWALPAGFYWQNFVNAWNGAKMGEYMLNSVIVTALALALLLVVALPAAYCLSRFHFKGCKVLNTLFMAGLFINVNYIVVPIFLMLRDGDVWLKGHFGSGFLLNNLVVLAVVYAATALPFTIYLLSGYFATLPHDFVEAAYIDGASYLSTMTRIIFPMAKPSIITIILFNFLSFWNEYIISMTLMSSTSAPRGRAPTSTALRAGYWPSVKNSAYTAFMAAKSLMCCRNTVVLTTLSMVRPAASTMALMLRNTWRVCSWMPPGTNSPVLGSKGTWPLVTRKLPQSMAWE